MGRLNRTEAFTLAAVMLALGVSRHYGWHFFPPEMRGLASKGLGAVASLGMLLIVCSLARHAAVYTVAAWWAMEDVEIVLCTAWYSVDPWPVAVGQALCSARAGFDLGAVGIVLAAVVLWRITAQVRR